jgi:hypothetical protein
MQILEESGNYEVNKEEWEAANIKVSVNNALHLIRYQMVIIYSIPNPN